MHPIDKMVAELEENIRAYKAERDKASDTSSLLDDSPTDAVAHVTGDGCRYAPDDPDVIDYEVLGDDDGEPVSVARVDEDVADTIYGGTIGDIGRMVNAIALTSGWWNKHEDHGFETTINGTAEKLLMIHSEISEAVEDMRVALTEDNLSSVRYDDDGKPYGFATELADIIIRTLDLAEWLGIDIENALARKITFNSRREFRHGNKNL